MSWVVGLVLNFVKKLQLKRPDCLHGLLPGPFLLKFWDTRFMFLVFPYFFLFRAVREIGLAISSAFEHTLIYRIVSYRMRTASLEHRCKLEFVKIIINLNERWLFCQVLKSKISWKNGFKKSVVEILTKYCEGSMFLEHPYKQHQTWRRWVVRTAMTLPANMTYETVRTQIYRKLYWCFFLL